MNTGVFLALLAWSGIGLAIFATVLGIVFLLARLGERRDRRAGARRLAAYRARNGRAS
jgi:hypothetical protein